MLCLNSRSLVVLLMTIIFLLLTPHGTSANYGKDFLLALPGTYYPDANANIYITPFYSDLSAHVQWSSSNGSGSSYIEASGYGLVQIALDRNQTAVHLWSNDSLVVLVSIVLESANVSIGTYLASPIEQLGSQYTAVTQCGHGNCFLLIASPSNNVKVNITFRLTPSNGSVKFELGTFKSEWTIVSSMNAWQIWQLNSGNVDATGSIISSSQPVVIVGGGDLSLLANSSNSDFLIEQMPAKRFLGTQFILVNFDRNGQSSTKIKVVYTEKNTTLCVNTSELLVFLNCSYWTTYALTTAASLLSSDKPVNVEMIYEDSTDKTGTGTAASVTIAPLTSWAYEGVTLLDVGLVTVITTNLCTQNIFFDGVPITSWTQIENNAGFVYTKVPQFNNNLTRIFIQGRNYCSFTGYVEYKNGDGVSAFPLVLDNLSPLTSASTDSLFTESCLSSIASTTTQTTSDDSQMSLSSTEYSHSAFVSATNASWGDDLATYLTEKTTLMIPSDNQSTMWTTADKNLAISSSTITLANASINLQNTSSTITIDSQSTTASLTSSEALNTSVTTTPLTTKSQTNTGSGSATNSETADSVNAADNQSSSTVNSITSTSTKLSNESITSSYSTTKSGAHTDSNLTTNPEKTDSKNTNNELTNITVYPKTVTSSEPNPNTLISIEAATGSSTNSNINTTTVTSLVTTTETQANVSSITETSTNIAATAQTPTHNDTTDNFTLVYNTTHKQCACNCRTTIFRNMTTKSPYFLPSLIELQNMLLINTKTLTSYTMTKNSLDNVEVSSMYYGSTIGFFVILIVFACLISLDLMNLCCKISRLMHKGKL